MKLDKEKNQFKKKKKIKRKKKYNNKMSNIDRAKLSDMSQIDWFPVDPYCD